MNEEEINLEQVLIEYWDKIALCILADTHSDDCELCAEINERFEANT